MKWRGIFVLVLVVAAIVAGSMWAFRAQPIGVDLAEVGQGTLVITVDDEGVAMIKDTYQVSTPMAGDVQRSAFHVGDEIALNDVVATVVPQLSSFLDRRSLAEAQAAVGTAEAAITAAKTSIAAAQSELTFWQGEAERIAMLQDRELASVQAGEQVRFQRDQRQVGLSNARATLRLRYRQLEQAQARLLEPENNGGRDDASYDIRAPGAGQVLEIANESTRSLPAGAHLLTIGDPHNLEIAVDLLSSDVVKIAPGAAATIDGWGGGHDLSAQVRRIEPIGFTKISALGIEEQRVRVHLEISSPPDQWQTLGHLYAVFVRIQSQRIENATLLPSAAMFRVGDQWAVFTVEEGIAHLAPVRLGARDGAFAQVLDGIEPGVQVILHPNDQIVDGGEIVARVEQ